MARLQALAVALALLVGPALAAAKAKPPAAAPGQSVRSGRAQESSDMLFGR